ncbi:MAG: hypothetical protein [Olavius algarvensis Delta 4 endosymbiont]|nr:MAG: hypothetical protein [Olavius algarvensis Delta 4 endosymbiont]
MAGAAAGNKGLPARLAGDRARGPARENHLSFTKCGCRCRYQRHKKQKPFKPYSV